MMPPSCVGENQTATQRWYQGHTFPSVGEIDAERTLALVPGPVADRVGDTTFSDRFEKKVRKGRSLFRLPVPFRFGDDHHGVLAVTGHPLRFAGKSAVDQRRELRSGFVERVGANLRTSGIIMSI